MKIFHLLLMAGCLVFGTAAAQDENSTEGTAAPGTEDVAQEPAADQNQEAGKYERKSVSFVNALWLLDASTRGMPSEMVGYMLNKAQQGISMKRFDYNPLPDTLVRSFVDAANAKEKLTIDDVAKLMEEQLVPQITKILEAEREMRAANLLTDQQKNSFITDKAKELGVTGEQLETIMNSAYLYLPVIADFSLVKSQDKNKQESWKCTAQCGILWYSLSVKGDQPKVTMRVKKMTRTMGLAKVKTGHFSNYTMDGESVTPEQFAFRSMVKSGVKNLVVATQSMPEFKLAGQVLEVAGSNVGFDLGKNEGLRLDDKYRIMVLTEAADGSVKQEATGWTIVKLVGDSSSKEGYKSKAQIIAGTPGIGAVMMEYPRLGIDVHLGYKSFPVSTDGLYTDVYGDSLEVGMGSGFELLAMYNIGRLLKINQLYLGFGWGLGGGSATGYFDSWSTRIEGVSFQSFEVPLMKRFYFGRLGLDAEAALIIQQCTFELASVLSLLGSNYDYALANNTLGFGAGLKAEYALTASLNLNLGALFQMNGESTEWEYLLDGESLNLASGSFEAPLNHSGLSLRAGLTYSPASLPFSPWEMLRGSMGW